jgi:hypothetical protein
VDPAGEGASTGGEVVPQESGELLATDDGLGGLGQPVEQAGLRGRDGDALASEVQQAVRPDARLARDQRLQFGGEGGEPADAGVDVTLAVRGPGPVLERADRRRQIARLEDPEARPVGRDEVPTPAGLSRISTVGTDTGQTDSVSAGWSGSAAPV